MSKDLFKNLIEAVVALAADEVVKLLDDKREPIADAALALYLDHGFTLNWLRARKAEEILGACVSVNRNQDIYVGLIKGGMRCMGVQPAYALWKPAYPDRERTADAAQYLWRKQHSGDWTETLRRYTSEEIRVTASRRQEFLCTEAADAAWIDFDSGYWQAHHFIHNNVSAKRIIEAAEAIKDCASSAESAPRKMIGVLKLDGFGKFGQVVRVEGIPIFDDSQATAALECEFVKNSAEAHGLTLVAGVTCSFGPGICQ